PAPGILGAVAFGQPFAPTPPSSQPPDGESIATQHIETAMAAPNNAVPPGYSFPVNASGRYELLQTKLFHAPRTPLPPGGTDDTLPAPVAPTLDFHQAVSFVNDHPALQRLFGLVVDLEVFNEGIALPNSFAVSVSWEPQLVNTTNVF